jgi:hypothetical protein
VATHSNRPKASLSRDVSVAFEERCGGWIVTVYMRDGSALIRAGDACGECGAFEPDRTAFPRVKRRDA